jgi:UDP-sugar transporter A1/2/3
MHHSRVSTPPSHAYSAATAVLLNELLKGFISLLIAFCRIDPPMQTPHAFDLSQTPYSHPSLTVSSWTPRMLFFRLRRLAKDVFSPDCWKLSIPAILYGKSYCVSLESRHIDHGLVIQNHLQFIAVSNLDAATFQVSYQMKILTTAAFSVLLLRKKLTSSQWLALLCLAIGVGVVQIQAGTGVKTISVASSLAIDVHTMHQIKGMTAVVAACFTSGLAGVYFEMVLKNSQGDLWVRNVQLSLFSLLPGLLPVLVSYPRSTDGAGWFSAVFRNFGVWAWATVAIQAFGGLVTALVIKYSDNILKGFATSLSIVMSFLASIALFDFQMTFPFILGSVIVLIATWMYNQSPMRPGSKKEGAASLEQDHSSSVYGSDGKYAMSSSTLPMSLSSASLSSLSSSPALLEPDTEKKPVSSSLFLGGSTRTFAVV